MLEFLMSCMGAYLIMFFGAFVWGFIVVTWETLTAPPVEAEEDMDKFTRWEMLGK